MHTSTRNAKKMCTISKSNTVKLQLRKSLAILTLSFIKRYATRLMVLESTASILANISAYGILRP